VSGTVFKSAGRPGGIDRAVYGTIVITSTLVIYDGWANLRVLGAVAVILGPCPRAGGAVRTRATYPRRSQSGSRRRTSLLVHTVAVGQTLVSR
jgi:hypothetical protein